MLGMFNIEMSAEHALVIAIALKSYIAETELAEIVADHDVDSDDRPAVELARWMQDQLTMMFYQQAKQNLEYDRDALNETQIELLEQIVSDVERGNI